MKTWMQSLKGLLDSPALLQDLASLFLPWRLGFWLHILNLVLLSMLFTMVFLGAKTDSILFSLISQNLGLGQYLACTLLLGLGFLCTVLVPLRASGLIEGPRWGRYFDQIVSSGISPARYIAGKVAAQNLFFLFLIMAAMPYVLFCLSLGGAWPSYIMLGIFSLWVYSNLITLVTLEICMMVNEVWGVIMSTALFMSLLLLGLNPTPPVFGLVTPFRYLVQPFYDALAKEWEYGSTLCASSETVIAFGSLNFAIGSLGFFLLGAIFFSITGLLYLMLGPARCLVKANSTFGELVLPGNLQRKGIGWLHSHLRRRSEIAFFYENRAPWLTRWEIPLRYGNLLTILAVPIFFLLGVLHLNSKQWLTPVDFYIINLGILIFSLLLVGSGFYPDRFKANTTMKWGSFCSTVAPLNAVGFALLLGSLALLAWGLPALRNMLQGTSWFVAAPKESFFNIIWEDFIPDIHLLEGPRIQSIIPLALLLAVEFYAIAYILESRCGEGDGADAMAILGFVAILGLPVLGSEFVLNVFPHSLLATLAPWLSLVSPITYAFAVTFQTSFFSAPMRSFLESGWYVATPLFHVLVTVVLVRLAIRCHVRLKTEARKP